MTRRLLARGAAGSAACSSGSAPAPFAMGAKPFCTFWMAAISCPFRSRPVP
ncbi:hypothetical protein [Frankia sp. AgB1.8]|uniref:hypothetical protein n=1 Tax=Frankia sp. AgB1.8 TaxID=2792839 RepID=UPI001EE481DF|nr:hypothetical protein [Frankia sp. AgB1.8]